MKMTSITILLFILISYQSAAGEIVAKGSADPDNSIDMTNEDSIRLDEIAVLTSGTATKRVNSSLTIIREHGTVDILLNVIGRKSEWDRTLSILASLDMGSEDSYTSVVEKIIRAGMESTQRVYILKFGVFSQKERSLRHMDAIHEILTRCNTTKGSLVIIANDLYSLCLLGLTEEEALIYQSRIQYESKFYTDEKIEVELLRSLPEGSLLNLNKGGYDEG